MGVIISAEQQDLEKKQTSSPNPGSPAEPRQKKFPQQQLHLEEQKRAGEDRDPEEKATHINAKRQNCGLIKSKNRTVPL